MIKKYRILEWDSDFFGYKVGQVLQSKLDSEILAEMHEENINLAYFVSSGEVGLESKFYKLKRVDKKVVYEKQIQFYESHSAVQVYTAPEASTKLIQLAIESGRYSRFNIDENIENKKFEELYTQWIVNSVSKKFAKEVLVYKVEEVVVGLVSIGVKNNKASIGIIAVDSSYRRQGVGKELLKAAEAWAFQNNLKLIQVVTQAENEAACRLYEGLGYSSTELSFFYHLWKT